MSFMSAAAGGILPVEYSALITDPIEAEALAFNTALATVVRTGASSFQIPILDSDAGASWVAEGAEIAPEDPVLSEMTVTPSKVAGLTIISNELANDSSPDAQKLVGDGLARSIIGQLNAAFLGDLAAPAPKGLASLTGTATADGALDNLDVFADAVAAAEAEGANVTGWLLSPADALTVAKLKDSTGSNKALTETPRMILGRPVIVSAKATTGTIWGLDAAQVMTVLREDVELAVSDDAYFSSDRIAIRATLRAGFGFPRPQTVVKISIPGA